MSNCYVGDWSVCGWDFLFCGWDFLFGLDYDYVMGSDSEDEDEEIGEWRVVVDFEDDFDVFFNLYLNFKDFDVFILDLEREFFK